MLPYFFRAHANLRIYHAMVVIVNENSCKAFGPLRGSVPSHCAMSMEYFLVDNGHLVVSTCHITVQ